LEDSENIEEKSFQEGEKGRGSGEGVAEKRLPSKSGQGGSKAEYPQALLKFGVTATRNGKGSQNIIVDRATRRATLRYLKGDDTEANLKANAGLF